MTARLRWIYLLTSLSAAAVPVHARQQADFSYPAKRVWATAVRLLRVDLASPIKEKDQENGYFLFDYPHLGEPHGGSVEIVPRNFHGVAGVRVVVQLADLPSYVERMMLTRLSEKLVAEYGPPGGPEVPAVQHKEEKQETAPAKAPSHELGARSPAK